MYLRELSSICISPLRIAFDHLGLKSPYETAIRYAHEFGMNDLSNYMLYNFHDSPADLFERMYLNVKLNEELAIRIYSFPMRYQPTDLPDRSHVGDKWNRYNLRSVQLVLQATRGVVSGGRFLQGGLWRESPGVRRHSLPRPHHMIFNRQWYERYEGRGELDEWRASLNRLTQSEQAELITFLSRHSPSLYRNSIRDLPANLRGVAEFYVPLPREVELEIRRVQQKRLLDEKDIKIGLSPEQIVEDAGLEDEEAYEPVTLKRKRRRQEAA